MNIFQDSSLGVDNPQSREEDEELEEQRRRQEELADLLAAGIHAFNYDESTINSSVTSAEGVEVSYPNPVKIKNGFKYDDSSGKTLLGNLSDAERNYKNAAQEDQLRVLYEVRVREISSLRDEFSRFRDEKAKEISILKNKVTLSEAEIRHLQVTLSNSESLLVEKTELINNLKENVISRDREIENLNKIVEQQNLEICTYESTVNELQLKLCDNNPFSAGSRKLNSEELQKAHHDQIVKLETLLQEQSKKVQILEKEKSRFETDIKKLVKNKNETDEENNLTIVGLSKKLQNTQQQCKDLFLLGEAIKKESDHFKERMQQLETNRLDVSGDGFHVKTLDKETMMVHIEKLKRMLLDKDVEINTLKAKLKFYESDLTELFEYRKILSNMYSPEVKPCSNSEHEELIIFMQRQLQSYQQAVEDRNSQIMSLNMVNKELQEKIEEMIQQTRTDIQNLSEKYSLPQLETMSNELKNAEETINDLKKQLLDKHDDKSVQELIKKFEIVGQQKQDFEERLSETKQELKKVEEARNKLMTEVEEFKKTELQLTEENDRVKAQLQKICLKLGLSEADIFESDADVHEVSTLKTKYGQVHDQLRQVLAHLENVNPKRANFNIIFNLKKQIQGFLNSVSLHNLEGKEIEENLEQWDNMLSDFIESLKHSDGITEADSELKDSVEELTNAKTMLEGEKFALEYQLKSRANELEEARKEIAALKKNKDAVVKESEDNVRTIHKLNDQINNLKKCLTLMEENKLEVEKQLENTQKQLNEAKQETLQLHKEISEANDNVVRKNLLKELKDVENVLEKSNSDISGSDIFQKCLQAQVLKAEIALREQLHEESVAKLQKIEEQYKNVIVENFEMHNKEKQKWKNQEANYRKQFAAVLEECGKKMEELEKENISLIKQINAIVQEYNKLKSNAISSIEKYNKIVVESKKTVEGLNKQWATLLENYMFQVTNLEKRSEKTAKNVVKKIGLKQTELNLIENMYDEKIKKIKSERISKHSTG